MKPRTLVEPGTRRIFVRLKSGCLNVGALSSASLGASNGATRRYLERSEMCSRGSISWLVWRRNVRRGCGFACSDSQAISRRAAAVRQSSGFVPKYVIRKTRPEYGKEDVQEELTRSSI